MGIPEDVARTAVDARSDGGDVVVIPKRLGIDSSKNFLPARIFEQDRATRTLRISPGAAEAIRLWKLDMDLDAELPGINSATGTRFA